MAVTVASLQAVLSLDKKNFDTGLKESKSALGDFASGLASGLGFGAGFGAFEIGTRLITGAKDALIGSINAAREATAVNKQLEAVIRSTGGAAGVTVEAARDMADSLSLVTNFEDDVILSGENLLLTFTKIGSDVFPRATETMLDMSQALGQDLKSSAIQLGKALNDPIKGMTALQRVGVTFSAQQKEQIKDFVRQGELAKAQGVILDELATEFGGSAKTLADPFIILGNVIGELQEKLGGGVLPILNQIAQAAIPALQLAMASLKGSFGALSEGEIKAVSQSLSDIFGTAVELFNAFSELGSAVVEVGIALGIADKNSTGLGVTIKALSVVIGALAQPIRLIASVISFVAHIFESWGFIINRVKQGWDNVMTSIRQGQGVVASVTGAWNTMSTAIQGIWNWVGKLISRWRELITVMSQAIGLDPQLESHSPTPLEMGLRGITDAINSMPRINSLGGGMTPMAAGGGNTSIINVNIAGVSATSTTTGDPTTKAIEMTLAMLRRQLGQ